MVDTYQMLVKPVLFKMDPEFVHDRFIFAGKLLGSNPLTRGMLAKIYDYEHPALVQHIHGITFRNPIGLAAGFDKDCNLMHTIPSLGFGFEEVGSITAHPYSGNQKPRLVRLPEDKSILVYYGLKNKGARILRQKLQGTFSIPIGVNVAKTNKEFHTHKEKIDDWVKGVRLLKDRGAYLTINVSCPNTYDPQNFNDPKLLASLLRALQPLKLKKPAFIKLSADISNEQLEEIIRVCDQYSFVKGFILTNLIKDRSKLQLRSKKELHHKGGLSGKVVMPRSMALVRRAYQLAGDRYIIIGCGGIFTADDAYAYIRSGARLLQLITGMIYGGPSTIQRINKGLVERLHRDGFENISQAVGADFR